MPAAPTAPTPASEARETAARTRAWRCRKRGGVAPAPERAERARCGRRPTATQGRRSSATAATRPVRARAHTRGFRVGARPTAKSPRHKPTSHKPPARAHGHHPRQRGWAALPTRTPRGKTPLGCVWGGVCSVARLQEGRDQRPEVRSGGAIGNLSGNERSRLGVCRGVVLPAWRCAAKLVLGVLSRSGRARADRLETPKSASPRKAAPEAPILVKL